MTVQAERYVRKLFFIDAVRVNEDNIKDVAGWCQGEFREQKLTKEGVPTKFIKVWNVNRPLNERQTKAFIGDWILSAGRGFKVYTNKAFELNFDRAEE
jgi:hypothetical protein